MGKGDIKSKRGKIARGSYGVRRKRKASVAPYVAPVKKAANKPKEQADAETPAKKPAAKKATAKKAASKKTTAKKAAE